MLSRKKHWKSIYFIIKLFDRLRWFWMPRVKLLIKSKVYSYFYYLSYTVDYCFHKVNYPYRVKKIKIYSKLYAIKRNKNKVDSIQLLVDSAYISIFSKINWLIGHYISNERRTTLWHLKNISTDPSLSRPLAASQIFMRQLSCTRNIHMVGLKTRQRIYFLSKISNISVSRIFY